MKLANVKSLLVLVCGVVFGVIIILSLGGKTHAASATCGSGVTCPYLKVYGGDVMAGGWFGPSCSTNANYQSWQSGSSPVDANNGGILTYAKISGSNAAGGASGQYGAFALGSIEGGGANYGFYSDGAAAGGPVNALSFANTNFSSGTPWGGQFEGRTAQGHCITDFFTSKQSSPNDQGSQTSFDLSTMASSSPQYLVTASAPPLVLTNNLPAGVKNTLFVNGSVYIGSNITYPTSYTEESVPKFALVVMGNIYIDPAVTELDGLYIAEPTSFTSPTTDGVIWTCHLDDTSTTADGASIEPGGACNNGNKLDVEGALIAKQVNFLRALGDVSSTSASTSEDSLSGGQASTNIGEIINYTPAMVIGGPFFNKSSGTAIDSLISLPPVY